MILLEVDYWKILESISITLTFIIGSVTFYYGYKEYKRHNKNEELNFYYKLKTDILSTDSKLLYLSILEQNIILLQVEKEQNF